MKAVITVNNQRFSIFMVQPACRSAMGFIKKGDDMKKKFYLQVSALFLIFMFTGGCVKSQGPKDSSLQGRIVYNKYNIHAQKKTVDTANASYANWTGPFAGHFIITPGTPLKVNPWRSGVKLIHMEDQTTIFFMVDEKKIGMSSDEYIDMITSPEKISPAPLSALDRKGVEQGKAFKGMTKKGVMTALGYPSPHRTSSLDSEEWIYWTNRFGTIAVVFNHNDRVTSIRN